MYKLATTNEYATAIRNSLERYRLKQWGFVMFRCTYKSREKWDQFIGLIKEHASDYFESRGMEAVYDHMAWTIIEDAEGLEGADLVTTARKFTEAWRVVDDAKAREAGGYFCMVVRADMALPEEGDEQAEEQEDEEEQLLDVRKRIKIDKLVLLYALVLDANSWYNIWLEDGVAEI